MSTTTDFGSSIVNWILINHNLFLYLSVVICVPSALLYVAELFTIIRHKEFYNSFYALYVARAIANLLNVANSFLFRRIPNLLPNLSYASAMPSWPNWCLLIFPFLVNYTWQANEVATTLILLNRLTAIAWPFAYKRIWRKMLPLAILAIFILPLPSVHVFSANANVTMHRDVNGTILSSVINSALPDINENVSLIGGNFISAILFLVVCLVINIFTLIYYKKNCAGNHQNSMQTNQAKVEQKLAVYAFITFVGQMLNAVFFICLYFVTLHGQSTLEVVTALQYEWSMDLGTVVLPSWLLLWASSEFRKKLLANLFPCVLH